MSVKQFNPRTFVLIAFMAVAALIRILFTMQHDMSPITNFTPIGAMALFGGTYFSKSGKAFLFPVLTLWLSDLILNRFVYYHEWRLLYEGFYWTYGSFILIVLAGKYIITKASFKNIVLASLVAVLIHWIGTSPGCIFIEGSMYPHTVGGWLTSLVVAIPYESDFLIGTLVYSGILFGGFELLQRRYSILQPAL